MPDLSTHSFDYCSDLLRRQDEDRWLSARYAKEPLRSALIALGAFRLELRRIPASVSEPALGEIRLQWWREALDEIREGKPPRAHPVLEAISEVTLANGAYAPELETMIDSVAHHFYGEGFASIDELQRFASAFDGVCDQLAVKLAGGSDDLAERAGVAGVAFALAREGRSLAPNLKDVIQTAALQQYRHASPLLRTAPAETAPALLHLSLTPLYARIGGKPFPLRKRLKLFSAMAFADF